MQLRDTLPAAWYTDPNVFEQERHRIFAREWMPVAYEHQFRGPGDFVTEDVAGWHIFIRRTPEGDLTAFHNVCPHRAGPIVYDGPGCTSNLVCRYHGWAFNADGSLRNARDFGDEPTGNTSLLPVQVAAWRGFVFVNIDPTSPPLLEWLGGFPEAVADIPFGSYRFHSRSSRLVACNWKVYGDNAQEGYHLPIVHPLMARESATSQFDVRIGDDPRWNLQVMPPREGTTFSTFGYFWPAFSFDLFPGGFAVERWMPRGNDRSELIFEYFFAEDALDVDHTVKMSEEVADEDARVCEHVYRNLRGDRYDTGRLSPKWEYGIGVFHDMVRAALGGA